MDGQELIDTWQFLAYEYLVIANHGSWLLPYASANLLTTQGDTSAPERRPVIDLLVIA